MSEIRRSTLSRRALLGGALGAGGMLLAGCGDDSPDPAGTGRSSLRIGIPSDVTPAETQVFRAANQPLRRTVFDYVLDKKADGTYQPALASGWEWSADKSTLVLTLREGVTYHSGRAFGPDDVVASVQAALATTSGVQAAKLLQRASGISKTGKNQVTVTFDKPFTGYLDALAMLPIIDVETFANVADGKQVVGTGPFSWKSWSPGRELLMERNGNYWRSGRPYLDALELRVIKEPQAMLAAIRSGELDLVNRMIPRDAAGLKKDSRFSVSATEGFDVYVGANVAVKPLDDIRVRQAVAYALDRERIADQVYSGFAEPSCVAWSSSTPGVTPEQVGHYSYDIGKGKALLQAAGATGTEVELTSFASDPAYAAIAEIVQYGLEQVGLKVKPVAYDQAQFVKQIQTASFRGLWVTPVALTTMGEVTALLTANPLKVGKNAHNFTDPGYGAKVDALLAATTDQESAAATTALTDLMLEQAYHNTVVQAETPNVSVAALTGVAADLTLAIDLTEAKLGK